MPADQLLRNLATLYGADRAPEVHARLTALVDQHRQQLPAASRPAPAPTLCSRDWFLIAYPDHVQQAARLPLRALNDFLAAAAPGLVTGLHLLPFFPSSSDEGFSVVDFRQVDQRLGTWNDVARLSRGRRLMADLVLNHVSRQHAWFQAFLRQEPPYDDYFITVPPGADTSSVVRARTHPLLTPVETANGTRLVWTTFSADQMDLNYHNPLVLAEIVDTMLFYLAHGVRVFRLDAVAYLWKELGTPCIHLPQTHAVVRVMRSVLNQADPGALLVTETNVPHAENVRYFGNGADEANLVYQFTLPPLVLDALTQGSAADLSAWAAGLSTPSAGAWFLNFLASHDGIGVRPAEDLLPPDRLAALDRLARDHGGQISLRTGPDGADSPYELNITWYDALNDPACEDEPAMDVARYACSQAILLSLAGVPALYFTSLFGARNWTRGARQTGQARSINRRRFTYAEMEAGLHAESYLGRRIWARCLHLLDVRSREESFHPSGAQRVLDLGASIFAVERRGPADDGAIVCLHNVTNQPQAVTARALPGLPPRATTVYDLISRRLHATAGAFALPPYGIAWLKTA